MELFAATDPLGNRIVLTRERWNHAWRHEIRGIEKVKRCIQNPDEIRKSRQDSAVHLYYQELGDRYLCAVVQVEAGFIITAYEPKDRKTGEIIWTKNS
ncbi:MAG: PBECR2 nuclease fold domain-containing protein [Candidatus Nanohaloarchaea archaeon]|nr:PBECR2 nuclease fold domain-containing protein [Candidatus Nanohaloarchaea archaeon]